MDTLYLPPAPRPETGPQFRAAISGLGYSNQAFADLVKVDVRSVRRWSTGEQSPPGWVGVVIRLLQEARKADPASVCAGQ